MGEEEGGEDVTCNSRLSRMKLRASYYVASVTGRAVSSFSGQIRCTGLNWFDFMQISSTSICHFAGSWQIEYILSISSNMY